MLASAASEKEKGRPFHGLQLVGVPMVGNVLLHGIAGNLVQVRLPGGGTPFRHPTELNLIQAVVKVGETFSLKGLDHTCKGFVQRRAG